MAAVTCLLVAPPLATAVDDAHVAVPGRTLWTGTRASRRVWFDRSHAMRFIWRSHRRLGRIELPAQTGPVRLISMTYCLAQCDPRRVFIALNGRDRVMYPLRWDPDLAVSDDNGHPASPAPCSEATCFHSPEAHAN
jgi:hypothetical protein